MKHKFLIPIFICLCVLLISPIHIAQSDIAIKTKYTKQEIQSLIVQYAEIHKVSAKTMNAIVATESGYNTNAIGVHDGKTGCTARGLAQLNDCYMGKNIPASYATNPHYSLNLLGEKLAQGQGRQWTSYRTCILKETIVYKGKRLTCAV